jgi:hypothetical protein
VQSINKAPEIYAVAYERWPLDEEDFGRLPLPASFFVKLGAI